MKQVMKVVNFAHKKLWTGGVRMDFLKREYIRSLSDTRLLSEIGLKGHNCLDTVGAEYEYNSSFLKSLINEAKKRKIKSENLKWARRILADKNEKKKFRKRDVDYGMLKKFADIARKRKSVRWYTAQKIPVRFINEMLSCAVEAPSSCNRQGWRFILVQDENDRRFLSEIRNTGFIKDAPLVVCVLIDRQVYNSKNEMKYTPYMDAGAAIMNILHAASSSGLSACWVNFGEAEVSSKNMSRFRKLFRLGKNLLPVSLVTVGFAAQDAPKPRREKPEYYTLNRFR